MMENKTTNTNSRLYSINWMDGVKSFIIAAVGSVLSTLMEILNNGALPTTVEVRKALILGIGAGASYITTTYFSNSKREVLKNDPAHVTLTDETPTATVTANVATTPTETKENQ